MFFVETRESLTLGLAAFASQIRISRRPPATTDQRAACNGSPSAVEREAAPRCTFPTQPDRIPHVSEGGDATGTAVAERGGYPGWWQTASTLLPSGSRTNAP